MSFSSLSPSTQPLVVVKWADITGSQHEHEVAIRRTCGWLLTTKYQSDGVESVVLASTHDDDGWADFSTFPSGAVLAIVEVV